MAVVVSRNTSRGGEVMRSRLEREREQVDETLLEGENLSSLRIVALQKARNGFEGKERFSMREGSCATRL
jgi:hypothetical protein